MSDSPDDAPPKKKPTKPTKPPKRPRDAGWRPPSVELISDSDLMSAPPDDAPPKKKPKRKPTSNNTEPKKRPAGKGPPKPSKRRMVRDDDGEWKPGEDDTATTSSGFD